MANYQMYEEPAVRQRRWLWPSLGLLVFALTLAGLFGADAHFLTDPATSRHLAAGKLAWETGPVLAADPFTYTIAEQSWMQHQWLFDLAVGGIELLGGVPLAFAFGVVAFALIPLALWRLLMGEKIPWPIALAYVCFAVVLLHAHWLLRPQLLNYLLLPVFLAAWYRYRQGLSTWAWAGLLALLLLWVNVHGGFVTALLFWGLAWTGRLIDNWRYGRKVVDDAALRWVVFGLVAGLVTLLNPYGWKLHGMIWHMVFQVESYAFYHEYQPLDLTSGEALAVGYLIIVALLIIGRFLPGRPNLGWESVLPIVVFAYFAIQSQRHVLILLLVAAVPICRDWAGAFRVWVRGAAAERVAKLSEYERQSRSYLWQVPALAVLSVGIFLLTPMAKTLRVGAFNVSPETVEVIRAQQHLFQRPFTTTWNGGPLAYHLGPEFKISFDDRNEFHGDGRMLRFYHVIRARAGWQDYFKLERFDSAILAPNWPLARELAADPTWKRLHADELSVVFIKR